MVPQDTTPKAETDGANNESEQSNEPTIVPSNLNHFDKHKEFVVLKEKVFNIQSISPKKIILKLKGSVNKQHPLPTGIYCIKEPSGDFKKV